MKFKKLTVLLPLLLITSNVDAMWHVSPKLPKVSAVIPQDAIPEITGHAGPGDSLEAFSVIMSLIKIMWSIGNLNRSDGAAAENINQALEWAQNDLNATIKNPTYYSWSLNHWIGFWNDNSAVKASKLYQEDFDLKDGKAIPTDTTNYKFNISGDDDLAKFYCAYPMPRIKKGIEYDNSIVIKDLYDLIYRKLFSDPIVAIETLQSWFGMFPGGLTNKNIVKFEFIVLGHSDWLINFNALSYWLWNQDAAIKEQQIGGITSYLLSYQTNENLEKWNDYTNNSEIKNHIRDMSPQINGLKAGMSCMIFIMNDWYLDGKIFNPKKHNIITSIFLKNLRHTIQDNYRNNDLFSVLFATNSEIGQVIKVLEQDLRASIEDANNDGGVLYQYAKSIHKNYDPKMIPSQIKTLYENNLQMRNDDFHNLENTTTWEGTIPKWKNYFQELSSYYQTYFDEVLHVYLSDKEHVQIENLKKYFDFQDPVDPLDSDSMMKFLEAWDGKNNKILANISFPTFKRSQKEIILIAIGTTLFTILAGVGLWWLFNKFRYRKSHKKNVPTKTIADKYML